jgi:DNA-directed RNA polymerase specialized sigma24 family protein
MTNSMNPELRELAGKHLEQWKANIRRDYERALRILQKSEGISEDKSLECLNTAVAELLVQWRKTGPPTYVGNWSAYLAHSAAHVNVRPPRRDERLLIFKSPVADTKEPIALDAPSNEPGASDLAVQREVLQKVWAEIVNLPRSQVVALICWAIGLSFAEIAKVLEVAEGRARVLKHKALETLKKKCAV